MFLPGNVAGKHDRWSAICQVAGFQVLGSCSDQGITFSSGVMEICNSIKKVFDFRQARRGMEKMAKIFRIIKEYLSF